jgi:dolichyldiphosphatase
MEILSARTMRIPFKETYVRYEEGDVLGWICAVLSMSPMYAAMFYVTVFMLRRDLQTVLMMIGQCVVIVLSGVMKAIIAQPRPPGQTDLDDYGMPSSHASFTFYIGIYLILQIVAIPSTKLSTIYKFFYSMFWFVPTVGVGFARVYLLYHSMEQVVVGAILGTVVAVLWYSFMNSKMIKSLSRALCQSALFQFLLIRDYADVEYACFEEYQAMNGNVKKSAKKLS